MPINMQHSERRSAHPSFRNSFLLARLFKSPQVDRGGRFGAVRVFVRFLPFLEWKWEGGAGARPLLGGSGRGFKQGGEKRV